MYIFSGDYAILSVLATLLIALSDELSGIENPANCDEYNIRISAMFINRLHTDDSEILDLKEFSKFTPFDHAKSFGIDVTKFYIVG